MKKDPTRREFIKNSTKTTAAVAAGVQVIGSTIPGKVLGANDKINMGFIGIGNRGSQLFEAFTKNSDVNVVALSDTYIPYMNRDYSQVDKRWLEQLGGRIPRMGEELGPNVKKYQDFRKLIDDKDVDAICIASPDHWHAIQTIMACQAGKDIYVEKPLTMTIKEGRRMVEVAKETDRVVQVGLNRRGSSNYQALAQKMKTGILGKVVSARAARISNMYPYGIGRMKPAKPPEGFDWNMWLGPRADRPYQFNMAPYKFRWWSDFSSQMGNWGVHYMDVIRWLTGQVSPIAVTAHGGKFALNDDRTIPDTMEALFEFASGMIVQFSIHEAAGGGLINNGEIEFRGTKGNLVTTDNTYKITPTSAGQFQDRGALLEAVDYIMEVREDITSNLIRNFLDSVKSRKEPWCPLEDGHRSTTFAHLANIALALKTRLEWDPETEKFTNSTEANNLLHYEYRPPWTLG